VGSDATKHVFDENVREVEKTNKFKVKRAQAQKVTL